MLNTIHIPSFWCGSHLATAIIERQYEKRIGFAVEDSDKEGALTVGKL